MLPFNILGDFTTPMAMAIRLFANMTAGLIIGGLLYSSLTSLSVAVYNAFGADIVRGPDGAWESYFNIFQVGIPAALSCYFDLFSGAIQAYVFSTLTMINVGRARAKE
jgi:F-type H+-transporting ATPase subunit a